MKQSCPTCSKLIELKNLNRHQAVHGEINIQCQYCSLTFTRKDNYRRHLNLHGKIAADVLPEANLNVDILTQCDEEPANFIVDVEQLNANLTNFNVEGPSIPNDVHSADFIHPFTCKVVGPRGSGKTSFTVSYIKKIASLTFHKIFIVTLSPDQPLYVSLQENKSVNFITIQMLETILKSNTDILIVLDDVMKETRFNRLLEMQYTRGRHQHISIISIEQDIFYSNCVERRNVDYFVLTRIRDTSCLQEFYKRFCTDVKQWHFITLYEIAVSKSLGFMIIDFVSHTFKYRINSFTTYYDMSHNKFELIFGNDKSRLTELNDQLQNRF